MPDKNTKEKILTCAKELCQNKGFNAFSYHDLAKKLKIKTASIHYHYPTKSDLGVALLKYYQTIFKEALQNITTNNDSALKQLNSLVSLMIDLENNQKICMCAMLASEYQTLSNEMKKEVAVFFLQLEEWVEERLIYGKNNKEFSFSKNPKIIAQGLVATLHGLLLSSRATADKNRLENLKSWLFEGLTN
jgi:TetR/AcrR family transcriptional repressor of nem operon